MNDMTPTKGGLLLGATRLHGVALVRFAHAAQLASNAANVAYWLENTERQETFDRHRHDIITNTHAMAAALGYRLEPMENADA